jgi:hypothetical protein
MNKRKNQRQFPIFGDQINSITYPYRTPIKIKNSKYNEAIAKLYEKKKN